MSKVTISAELFALLRATMTECELVGPDGQSAGVFNPNAKRFPDDLYAEPTREQLDASAASGEGIPHDEVMKRLGLE